MELNQKKWPRGILLLAGRSREDHISGPPGGTNNFSHLGTLSEELQSVMPKTVPISEIEIGDWRPVNVVAAAKLIEDLSRNDSGNKGQDEGKSQDLNLENFPHCNDINRGMLIKSIWNLLQLFIEIECFAPSHFYMLLDLILEMLKNQIPETLLNQRWMKTTLVSAWFLDERSLKVSKNS